MSIYIGLIHELVPNQTARNRWHKRTLKSCCQYMGFGWCCPNQPRVG